MFWCLSSLLEAFSKCLMTRGCSFTEVRYLRADWKFCEWKPSLRAWFSLQRTSPLMPGVVISAELAGGAGRVSVRNDFPRIVLCLVHASPSPPPSAWCPPGHVLRVLFLQKLFSCVLDVGRRLSFKMYGLYVLGNMTSHSFSWFVLLTFTLCLYSYIPD